MLIFILALQSPEASKDWSIVSKLCERTLRSVCAQTSPAFRAFLVCNTKPDTDFTHPNLTIIERDFPIPAATSSARMSDKWAKLKVGLIEARHLAPAHVMIVDADDCVSRRLAEHVARHSDAAGWTFDVGFLRDEGSRWLYRTNDFSRLCGSSAIVRLSENDFPHSEMEDAADYFILANGHGVINQCMIERGHPLRRLPFVGAIYLTSTGENDSGLRMRGWQGKRHMLRKLGTARPLTNRTRIEMGLYDIDFPGAIARQCPDRP